MTLHSPPRRPRIAAASIATGLAACIATVAAGAATAGPDVGAQVPAFQAEDQSGDTRDFDSLTGEKGLLLLFYRSADW